jgi:glycosyltransferase involved in cell wall biosynthesis
VGRLVTCHVDTERGWRGGEQQMAYLVSGLVARGHRALAVVQPGCEPERRLRAAGVETWPLPMRGEVDGVAMLSLARRIGAARADVVHLHTSHAHTLGVVGAFLGGRPAVVVSRRVDFSIFRRSFLGLNAVKYRLGVDRIVCVSEAVRDVLLRDGLEPERLSVVRSAVDPDRVRAAPAVDVRARLGLPPAARVVLAVGALVGHKGHRHLVEAMPSLVANVPDVHVVVVGEGSLRHSLEELARHLWIAPRLSLPGTVDDLAGWFSQAEVFVMPSLEEGLGTSVLDAMAAGLPVVASRAGGIPEMVRDGVEGLLVPPADAPALSAAIRRVLDEPDTRAAMSRAARARVDAEFHVDRMVDETLAVYEDVLAERARPAH